jgi:hypothetical protein
MRIHDLWNYIHTAMPHDVVAKKMVDDALIEFYRHPSSEELLEIYKSARNNESISIVDNRDERISAGNVVESVAHIYHKIKKLES